MSSILFGTLWRGPCPFCDTRLLVHVTSIQDFEIRSLPRPDRFRNVVSPVTPDGNCPCCKADPSLIWQAIEQVRSEGKQPGWERLGSKP